MRIKSLRMVKKSLALFVCGSFLASAWSCAAYTWKQKPLDRLEPKAREGLRVSAVRMKSGERVEFGREFPAQIKGNCVFGERPVRKTIEKSDIAYPKYVNPPPPPPFKLKTKGGLVYRVAQWREAGSRLVFDAYAPFPALSLTEIDFVTIKVVDPVPSLLLSLAIPFAIFGAIMGPSMNRFGK